MSAPSRRLFVVDDERVISDTWTIILHNAGYDAVGFSSPLEALRSLTAERPRLIITDVRMPEMSGVTLALRAKEIYPAIKVLLVSGMASTEDLTLEARMSGFEFPILAKPIHPAELLAVLHQMLEFPELREVEP